MRAYYYDNLPGDQRLPHDSLEPVSPSTLTALGVLYWHVPLNPTNPDDDEKINEIARERGYKNRDTIHVTKEGLGELYEEKLKMFFAEYVVLFCVLFEFLSFGALFLLGLGVEFLVGSCLFVLCFMALKSNYLCTDMGSFRVFFCGVAMV